MSSGHLVPLDLGSHVDFMEIFSGCGNLTLAAVGAGMRVGPSIDRLAGVGHGNWTFDLRKSSGQARHAASRWQLLQLLPKPCAFLG